MGLLGDIYSGTNTFKRKVGDLVANPLDSLAIGVTRFGEDMSLRQQSLRQQLPRIYGMLGGLAGTAPDEFEGSVLDPNTTLVREGAKVGFPVGVVASIYPFAAGVATAKGVRTGSRAAQRGMIGARFKGAGTPTNVPGFGKAYEIPDNFSSVAKEPLQEMQHIFKPGNPKLQDVLSHPELYRQYPELAQYPVKPLGLFQRDLHGAYDKGEFFLNRTSKEITKEELEQAHSTLLHEVQHAIQEIDKMPVGGMSSDFITSATKNAKLAATSVKNTIDKQADGILAGTGHEHERMALFAFPEYKKDLIAKFPQLGELVTQRKKADTLYKKISNKETMAFENYRRLAGEAQARAVQTRFKNPEQYQNDVLKSYDVDPNKLFVKRDVSDRPTDIFQDTTYEPPLFPDTTR